ncbi:MAG: HD domain-containing protein [Oscillospiraceae bacterium]|nr:HD domain-containing protein [Oscillospiraceae bacterium]MBQ4538206.1 HD domain-containing protein [Oscillospiraceae bacterium]
MISITKQKLCEYLPQFSLINDEVLREKTLDIWAKACSEADWQSLEDIPFTPGFDPKTFGFLHHVELVAQYSYEVATAYNKLEDQKINVDYVVAGALLHDVCKIVEYSALGGRTSWGQSVTHGIYGISLCREYGIPLEVTHIVASHTSKLSMANKTPEAIIVAKCDGIAAGCVHLLE